MQIFAYYGTSNAKKTELWNCRNIRSFLGIVHATKIFRTNEIIIVIISIGQRQQTFAI